MEAVASSSHFDAGVVGSMGQKAPRSTITGVITWYDIGRRFGFIKADDTAFGDLIVHARTMRECGFSKILVGMRVEVVVKPHRLGYQTVKVLSMDPATGSVPARYVSDVPNARVQATSDLKRVHVRYYNRRKGFGFLGFEPGLQSEENDIFIHAEVLRKSGFVELRPEEIVLVRFGEGEKGFVATEIYPADAAPRLHG